MIKSHKTEFHWMIVMIWLKTILLLANYMVYTKSQPMHEKPAVINHKLIFLESFK